VAWRHYWPGNPDWYPICSADKETFAVVVCSVKHLLGLFARFNSAADGGARWPVTEYTKAAPMPADGRMKETAYGLKLILRRS